MSLITRFFQPPNQSFFLFGPRGTGKTTFIHQAYPDALWVDFLNPQTERTFMARPERLQDLVQGQQATKIVIDEVQKVPTVLTVVHLLIEQRKELQFILTGSSSRKLKRAGIDLLAGRAIRCGLHPFMASELKGDFNLENALKNGLIPLIFQSNNPRDSLQAYISLYLKEEVLVEGLVRSLDNFSRFLETMSFSHGAILNITNIARECEVKRKTVEGYLAILEDLLIGYTIPVFTKRAQRNLTSHPKFYFFDAGVYRTLRPSGPLDRPEEIDGVALEGLVAQHLIAWNDYTHNQHQVAFWRTQTGLEVDFVVYGTETFCALEVKNSSRISPADLKALEAFKKDYPMAQIILLYRGKEKIMQKNVLCLPIEEFLKNLNPLNSPMQRLHKDT